VVSQNPLSDACEILLVSSYSTSMPIFKLLGATEVCIKISNFFMTNRLSLTNGMLAYFAIVARFAMAYFTMVALVILWTPSVQKLSKNLRIWK